MKKVLIALAAVASVSLTAALLVPVRTETEATAQVKSGPIPTPAPSIDPFSTWEKAIIQNVKDIADRFEAAMKETDPSWKLKKKSAGFVSRGTLPPEKGGGEVIGVSSNFQFKKGKTIAYVKFVIAAPSSVEEVAESFQDALEGRARGIAKGIVGFGDRAVIMMDLPGAPSTGTTLYFRKGKFKVNVDVDNQSRTRERNEEDAIRLGKIIEPLIY